MYCYFRPKAVDGGFCSDLGYIRNVAFSNKDNDIRITGKDTSILLYNSVALTDIYYVCLNALVPDIELR